MPICEECKYLRKTSYEYEEYECEAGVPEEDCRDFNKGWGCRHTQKWLAKRFDEVQEVWSEQYEGYAEWYAKLEAAESRCRKCNWYIEEEEKQRTERTDGRFVTNWCINIGEPCWEYWEKHETPPFECESYISKEDYVPTGWAAGLAEVIKAVKEKIQEEEE